jgi:tripartite-type tricarboxylate transporter receptor subunit TctC
MSRIPGAARAVTAMAVAALWPMLAQPAAAQTDRFFQGKTVRVIVGSAAGGGYDAYARLVVRHLGDHLPGRPALVVNNMPGASGVKATNYLYSIAPKDGTVFGTFNSAMPFYQVLGNPGVQFKAEELSWVGSLSQAANVIAVWHATGIKTLDDAKQTEIILGALTGGGTMGAYPRLLNQTLGTKFKVVTGYESGTQVTLAIERGEVQARGTTPWTTWRATRPDWVRDGKIVPIVQFGLKKDPDIPQVPLVSELAQNEEQRQIFNLISANVAIERPFAAPPDVPSTQLATLRKGFAEMAQAPAFLAEAERQSMDIDPLSGDDLAKAVAAIVATPPSVAEKVKQVIDSAE